MDDIFQFKIYQNDIFFIFNIGILKTPKNH